MILKKHIREYLERPLADHRWMKKLKRKDVLARLKKKFPRFKPWPKLRVHQLVACYLGLRFPRFAFYLDMGCVDGETEYLSPLGWVKIKHYMGGKVAQYDPYTRVASFVDPVRYVDLPCKEMYHFKTDRGCDQMLSGEHKMLVVARKTKRRPTTKWKHTPVCELPEYKSHTHNPWFFEVRPDEIVGERHVRFETTFKMDGLGLDLTDEQLRVQIAVHADGYLANKSKVVINIKKERKKKRLRYLLRKANIEFTERDRGGGFSGFKFVPPRHTKKFGPEWWSSSLKQKHIICDEVGHWDGSFTRSGGVVFFTRSRSCADFIQFCFASTGRRARGPGFNIKEDYVVHAVGNGRTGNLAHLIGCEKVPVSNGRKYCFEVPSGYLVLRRNGNIFVTGNSGKTLVTLELLRYWYHEGYIRRALIFVISDKAFPTWEKQIKQYEIDVPYISLDAGSSQDKWRLLETLPEGLVILHYPGAIAMVAPRGAKRGKKKGGLVIEKPLIKRLAKDVDAVVFDESTRAAGNDSLTSIMCKTLSNPKKVDIVYALAGRPFGRDPTLLWRQQYLVDRGASLGDTLELFRAAFFTSTQNPYSKNKYHKTHKFKKRMMRKLTLLSQHRSIMYRSDECVELPPVNKIIEPIRLPEEASAYYDRVVKEIMTAKGNFKEMKNAFVRMRQLSSGFLGFKDDETGDKAEIAFDENPKLERQVELVEGVPSNRKFVICYEFTFSGRSLYERLKEEGYIVDWLWSGAKNSRKILNDFTEGRTSGLIIQNKLGAYSLDGLQIANYQFIYESPVSSLDREQLERRIERQGQKHKVNRYDLVVEDTLDERILEFHAEGRAMHDVLTNSPETLLSKKGSC